MAIAGSVGKLTKAQRSMLKLTEQRTYRDGSGEGYAPLDGRDYKVAQRLVAMELASLGRPTFGSPLGYLKITDAGRAALAQQGD